MSSLPADRLPRCCVSRSLDGPLLMPCGRRAGEHTPRCNSLPAHANTSMLSDSMHQWPHCARSRPRSGHRRTTSG